MMMAETITSGLLLLHGSILWESYIPVLYPGHRGPPPFQFGPAFPGGAWPRYKPPQMGF